MEHDVGPSGERSRVVAASGALLGVAATLISSGLILKPNRIANGTAVSLLNAFGEWGWLLLGLWISAGAIALSPLAPRVRGPFVAAAGGIAPLLILWFSGVESARHAAEIGQIARTSLGAGVWLCMFAAYVVVFAGVRLMRAGWARALLAYLPVIGAAAIIASGSLSELAIAREFANNADSFWAEFRLHLFYVLGAAGIGTVSGVALGVLAARRPVTEPIVFGALNTLQVLPTLGFIGLLYPVLSAIAANSKLLADLGVRGVGWAPVIVVLTAYAMYPVARNAHSAILTLDPGVVDAARGVGMGLMRRFFEVELPIAAPVVIAGVRIALVQSTAGAIIAGLVGGGGLGTFVFLGAGETASDLILLGVVPIVALALFFDRSVHALEQALAAAGSGR